MDTECTLLSMVPFNSPLWGAEGKEVPQVKGILQPLKHLLSGHRTGL